MSEEVNRTLAGRQGAFGAPQEWLSIQEPRGSLSAWLALARVRLSSSSRKPSALASGAPSLGKRGRPHLGGGRP